MRGFIRGWKVKTLAVIAAVVALVAVEAAPAAAGLPSNITVLGISLEKVNASFGIKKINYNQAIWNDFIDRNNNNHITSLYLVVQSDGNLVLYAYDSGHPNGGVCWAPPGSYHTYTTNGYNPQAYAIYNNNNNKLELYWKEQGASVWTVKWQSPGYTGTSVDISGKDSRLYIGNTPYTPVCHW